MTEEIDSFLNRDPFVPFRIILTSGTTYDVRSPLQLIRQETRFTFYFAKSDGQAVFVLTNRWPSRLSRSKGMDRSVLRELEAN